MICPPNIRRPDPSLAKRSAAKGPSLGDLRPNAEGRSLRLAPLALRSGRRGELEARKPRCWTKTAKTAENGDKRTVSVRLRPFAPMIALHAERRDELGVEVRLERLDAALRAVARVLHAAERHFRQGKDMVIDRDHAALEGCADLRDRLAVLAVGIGREAPRQSVGLLHHAVEILERRDRRQRAERLIVHDLGSE